MKKFRNLLPIFFLAISQFVSATNYYVDNTNGLDSNTGLSSGTAWKTLAKVNASFSIFVPGDAILFKRGEIFAGTLTIAKSGTASNPITFGAYGTGADPDISGFTTLSSWTSEGNNIYSKTVSLASTTYNIVSVNGVNTPLGRYPNAGSWLTLDGFGGNTQLTDAAIDAASTNWTGAEVVIRPDEFRIERALISSHSSHTLTFSSISEGAVIGNGYFIQNDLRTLDVTNEWYYNGTKFYIYGDPSTRKVSVSAYTNGVVINSYDNIVFDHLKITGYGKNGFDITDGSNITIKNCSITFCGETAIYGYDETNGNSAGCIITDNLINQINSNGIYLKSQFTNSYIARNTVKNIGLVVGAPHATGWEMAYNGILLGNDSYPQWGNTNAIIELNKVDSIGYSGILMYGTKITARYNFVNHFGMKLNDGGGIYTYSLLANPGGRTGIIRKNIVLNGMGNHDMTQHNKYNDIRGIYMDGYTRGFTVDSNTVAFCSGPNFFINGARSSKIKYNTIYDARAGSPANLFLNEWTNSVELIDSMDMQYNKIISKDANESAIEYVSSYGKPASSAIIDNNYYARPMDDNNIFYVVPLGNSTTLAGWRTYSSQDANSNKSPLAITDTSKFDFYYNPDITSKVITLAQPMIDIASTKYANSITLSPYSSAVLIVDPAPSQTVIPVYTGSVVQSGSPSLLEVTYDVTLANIIPAASAFSVQVNSVARTVNSVTLSGSKVTLALSSPVVYGDVVKMSYTKPSVNPLQSTSGGQAASLVGQTVTNRVASLALPTYVSSSIENATPGILTLVYNMTLAPIVPSTSAFTVKVNSVVRAVNSVSISGTNVSLTLEYGVAYGDNITVDYTKPSTNPLQSSSGGQASSIVGQVVTNRVASLSLPAYVSSSIENATPGLLTLVYNMTLAPIVPSASAFTVKVNSVVRAVNSVSVSGTNVLLTLATPVVYGNVITIDYTKPSTNPLQSSSGGQAASIVGQGVTNRVASLALPAYVSSSIENATPGLLTLVYNMTLAPIVPSTSAFTVKVNSVVRAVNSVSVSGSNVSLTLEYAVAYGDNITVDYAKPSTNPLQSSSGGQAASIIGQVVTNRVGSLALPTFVSSSIENATPGLLTLVYNMTLAPIVPSASAFTVKVNSVVRAVNSVRVSGSSVSLTLEYAVAYGDNITVDYTKPSTYPLQTTAGGQAVSLVAKIVTNRVGALALPTYVSSSIQNATRGLLTMVYSLTLANIVPSASAFVVKVNSSIRAVNSVGVSGTNVSLSLEYGVAYGDNITVDYIKPSSNPLQTSAGVAAASIFSQLVTNNCINAVPTVALTSPVTNSSFRAPASITITANATDPDGSISLVEFYNGTTRLGSASSAPYSFTWSNVASGSYYLTATATDNSNSKSTSGSTYISVKSLYNRYPYVKLLNPAKGNTFKNLSSIQMEAVASDSDGVVTKVEFFNGSDKLIELTSAPYIYTWKDVPTGNYSITAIATDDSNDTTASTPVEIAVGNSLNDIAANSDSVTLFPNPNNGHFWVNFKTPLKDEKSTLVIIDLAGNQIYNGFVSKEETTKQFDLTNIMSGNYVMILKGKEILVTKKFIKK